MTTNTDPVLPIQLDLDDGKYRVLYDGDGGLRALRHGEPWRDLTGDKLVFNLVWRVAELEAALASAPPSAPVGVGDAEAVLDVFRRAGMHIESGATFSVRGQIAQLLNGTAALAQQPAAPSGEAVGDWVLVPRQPTLAMANAAWRDLESQDIDPEDVETPQIWDAMLAAAPQQPAGVDEALIAGAMEAAADACSRHVVCNEAIAAAVEYALAQQQGGRADG